LKLCFTVLAHHEPEIFARLVRWLDWPEADIVVHIDRRSEIDRFFERSTSNVIFTPFRRAVDWSGWSQTTTILELLDFARSVSDADYFIFLAGTDLPVRRRRDLLQHLTAIFPRNLLNHYPLVPGPWGYGLVDRFHLPGLKSRFMDLRNPKAPQTPDDAFHVRLVKAIEWELNARFRPRNAAAMRLFHGSSRWCLNSDTVSFVIDFYRSRASQQLRDYIMLCANSDELFVQTAILNSPYRRQCESYDEHQSNAIFHGALPPLADEKRVYMHYIDWSEQRENPAVLVTQDYEAVKTSGKFFACKFLEAQSMALIERLERDMIGD
jgi:hypothetical protein